MNESLVRHNSKFNFSLPFPPSFSCSPLSLYLSLFFPPLKHPLQASYPRHILGDEAPSSKAYPLVISASSQLFFFSILLPLKFKKQMSPLMKKIQGLEAPMELHHLTCPIVKINIMFIPFHSIVYLSHQIIMFCLTFVPRHAILQMTLITL